MRSITSKSFTLRTAVAQVTLKVSPVTMALLHEGKISKGNPLSDAKKAATHAAKNISQLIPHHHPIPVNFLNVDFYFSDTTIDVSVTVKAIYNTGVETEALTAASVAVLTLYDAMKSVDEEMEIGSVRLLRTTGKKSDRRETVPSSFRAVVVVVSDSVASGINEDISGKKIVEQLLQYKIQNTAYVVVPNKKDEIKKLILRYTDSEKVDLIITTGGTDAGLHDHLSDVFRTLIEIEIPGVAETMHARGQQHKPTSALSHSIVGIRGNALLISMPGSLAGATDAVNAIFPSVLHLFPI